ncbi:hypothetical protein HGM15179_021126 [Zosterops borbonicus]|uniref:Uncharacterized protein n=1 Tax=Zosterops borbonicus TaxID=364589 RepID=A0A8K1D7E8_9PASS|nr:hypothetical protein HGM15179_021126 [Zosterops borbonicus]
MGLEAAPDPKSTPNPSPGCSWHSWDGVGNCGAAPDPKSIPKSVLAVPGTAGTRLEVVVLLLIPNPSQIHPKIRVLAAPGTAGTGLEVVVLLLIPNPPQNPSLPPPGPPRTPNPL